MKKIVKFTWVLLVACLFSCETEDDAALMSSDNESKVVESYDSIEIESVTGFVVDEGDEMEANSLLKCTDANKVNFCLRRPIKAAQHIKVGNLKIKKLQEGKYKIIFRLKNGWEATKSHFYIGDCDGIPTNNAGNPKIGLFPLKNTYPCGTNKIVVIVNSSTDIFCVAAHAVVNNGGCSETAWAAGVKFNNNNWAMYIPFDGTDCEPLNGSSSGGTDGGGTDSGGTDGGGTDSGGTDGSGTDSGGTDGGGTDSGGTDGSGTDSGGTDGSGTDSSGTDGGGTDSGGSDGSGTDSGGSDGSGTDSGGTDGSGTDSGGTDGGGTDSGGTDGSGANSGGSTDSGTAGGGNDGGATDGGDGDAGSGTGSGGSGSGSDGTNQGEK